MGLPTFETVPAGATRQINGPLYGFRTVSVGRGARIVINGGIEVPTDVLLTVPTSGGMVIDSLKVTGPCVLQVANDQTADLNATAVPSGQSERSNAWAFAWGNRSFTIDVPTKAGGLLIENYVQAGGVGASQRLLIEALTDEKLSDGSPDNAVIETVIDWTVATAMFTEKRLVGYLGRDPWAAMAGAPQYVQRPLPTRLKVTSTHANAQAASVRGWWCP